MTSATTTLPAFASMAQLTKGLGISDRPIYVGIGLGELPNTFLGNMRLLETAPTLAWLHSRGTIVALCDLAVRVGQPDLVGSLVEACADRGIPVAYFEGQPYVSAARAKALMSVGPTEPNGEE